MKRRTKIILNSSFLIFNFLFTSCYTWWESKSTLDTKTTPGTLLDFLYRKPEITSLEAPQQVIASAGMYKDTVKLRWSEVNNATSYRIERAEVRPDSNGNYVEPEEGDFTLLQKYIYKTTYDDVILTNPGTSNQEYSYRYYYRICAENIRKGYESSEYTKTDNPETKAAGWLLSPPKNIDAWKGKSESEICISWDAVPEARYYQIYRSEKEKSGYELLDRIRANNTYFFDEISEAEQGHEFYYKVMAELSTGTLSAYSAITLGYSLKKGAPTAPDNVKVDESYGIGNTTDGIKIIWTSVSTPNAKYSIFRNSSVDSAYTLISTNLDSSVSTIIDKHNLKPGVIYYYYVQTVVEENGEKLKSPFSATGPQDQNPAAGFLLSAPEDIDILDTTNPDFVILKWRPAIGSDNPFNINYTYNIYYDYEQNGSYSDLTMSGVLPELSTDGYYELEIQKYSFIKISTVNNGTESDKSQTIAPYPQAPTNVTASKTSSLGGLEQYTPNTNGVYPVKITWDTPNGIEPYGYNIYRSTNPTSSFRKLNEEPITDGANSYIDENETARAGTYYYYKVVSINSLEKGKNGNDPSTDPEFKSSGYGAITRDQWFREYNKTVKRSQVKLTLMHKANDMDKLGSETINGDLTGTLSYKAAIAGLGAEITMHYENYSDFYIDNNPAFGQYFNITGNTDTTSNMSANGNMHGTVICKGMYPGYAIYDKLQIKSGAAGGGSYVVQTTDLSGNIVLAEGDVNWIVGEE